MTAVEDDRGRLAALVRELGVVRERVTLSSGASPTTTSTCGASPSTTAPRR